MMSPPANYPRAGPRQYDLQFRELPRLGLDIDGAIVLFRDDVVAHRQPKSGPFTRRLGREERIEHLFLHLGGDAGAVVANANFHGASEFFRGGTQYRLKISWSPFSVFRPVAA